MSGQGELRSVAQAWRAMGSGSYREAEEFYLAILREYTNRDSRLTRFDRPNSNLGELYQRMNDYCRAETFFQQVSAVAKDQQKCGPV